MIADLAVAWYCLRTLGGPVDIDRALHNNGLIAPNYGIRSAEAYSFFGIVEAC